MARILVVEDNEDLAFGLGAVLRFEGYQVEVVGNGEEGLIRAREGEVDLLILDLMLPGKSGFEVLRGLRDGGSRLPVLILTARSQETDVVMGFDWGADDYVTKPFSTVELLARVRALLRRTAENPGAARVPRPTERFGDIEVASATRTVLREGSPVELTPKEFDLLLALLGRNGAVASREELLKEVWEYGNARVPTRTVDVHVAELRRKLEADPANPRHILTVRKAGYRLER